MGESEPWQKQGKEGIEIFGRLKIQQNGKLMEPVLSRNLIGSFPRYNGAISLEGLMKIWGAF